MNRKEFLSLATAGALAAFAGAPIAAFAQETRFRTLSNVQPTDAPKGKIEVLEFFWFGCPHCYSLEPFIEKWRSGLPEDVVFHREHVPFRERKHQQLFFALQSIGQDKPAVMHAVFDAIHKGGKRMTDLKEMGDVVSGAGVERKLFEDSFNSFGVRTKMSRADKMTEAYGLDGVPALAVNGKYLTSPGLAGGNAQVLAVVDELIARERKGR